LLPGTPVDLGIGEPRAGGAALDHLGDRVAGHRPGADGAGLVHITDDETSWCEWKGQARYYTVRGADRVVRRAAWSYPTLMDACFVDDERARAQPAASTAAGSPGTWSGRSRARPARTGGEHASVFDAG